jgi:hypothetical protein
VFAGMPAVHLGCCLTPHVARERTRTHACTPKYNNRTMTACLLRSLARLCCAGWAGLTARAWAASGSWWKPSRRCGGPSGWGSAQTPWRRRQTSGHAKWVRV